MPFSLKTLAFSRQSCVHLGCFCIPNSARWCMDRRRTSGIFLEQKVWPQAPGALWVCRVLRHVRATRASYLRTPALLLFRGGDGGPGRVTSLRACTPSVALKGFLSDADPTRLADRVCLWTALPALPNSQPSPHFLLF